jgi:hypothetical protein
MRPEAIQKITVQSGASGAERKAVKRCLCFFNFFAVRKEVINLGSAGTSFRNRKCAEIAHINQGRIAAFLRVSQPLISHAKTESEYCGHPPEVVDGAPFLLISLAGSQKPRQCLPDTCTATTRKLKEQIFLTPEVENVAAPSRSWWPKLIIRRIHKQFQICTAERFEPNRDRLTVDKIAECFRQGSISDYDSVIDFDETVSRPPIAGDRKRRELWCRFHFKENHFAKELSEPDVVSVLTSSDFSVLASPSSQDFRADFGHEDVAMTDVLAIDEAEREEDNEGEESTMKETRIIFDRGKPKGQKEANGVFGHEMSAQKYGRVGESGN